MNTTAQAPSNGPLIFLVAGEPSGDVLGARLMAALRAATDNRVRFAGVGGPAMTAQGLVSQFPMADLAIMGLFEVIPHIPHLRRRLNETVAAIVELAPAAVITIDSPGFCFRLVKRLRLQGGAGGATLIHYVAPSVWAWKPGRAQRIAALYDHLLALLPFEPPYFEEHGLRTTFVGHSVIEDPYDSRQREAFRQAHGLTPSDRVVCVLPGSRRSEIGYMLPVFSEVVTRLSQRRPELRLVVPTVPSVAGAVKAAVAAWPGQPVVIEDVADKQAAFVACDVALATSGTVTLELAMAGVAAVMAYRVHPLTAWLVQRVIKVRFGNLINLLYDREVVPEFVQQRCRADLLLAAVERLLDHPEHAAEQRRQAQQALVKLGWGDAETPSRKAARAVLDAISYQHKTF